MFGATLPNTVYTVRCAHTNCVFGTTSHTPKTVIRHLYQSWMRSKCQTREVNGTMGYLTEHACV